MNRLYFILIIILISSSQLFSQTRLCFVGDTGTGSAVQERVGKVMELRGCQEVFILGDVVYPNGITSSNDPQIEEKFYLPYKNLFDRGVKFTLSMGNHDYRGDVYSWIKVAEKDPQIIFPQLYSYQIRNNVCLITLDSNTNYQAQAKWLKEVVYPKFKQESCAYTIAFGHHPYWSSGAHGKARGEVKKFLRRHIIGKVDAYLAGHDHNLSYEGSKEGTKLFVSGSGAKLRWMRPFPRHSRYRAKRHGFIAVDLLENQIKYNFIVLNKKGASRNSYQVHDSL